jgi:hypothetical protein
MIDDIALARTVHVLALVHWIGGVSIVTTVVLPRARALPDAAQALAAFEAFERRFAVQARVSILLAGLSGLYMLAKYDAWYRFGYASFWWLHLMEPFAIHRWFHDFALRQKDRAFALATRLHAAALLVSAIAIAAGVMGAHGGL